MCVVDDAAAAPGDVAAVVSALAVDVDALVVAVVAVGMPLVISVHCVCSCLSLVVFSGSSCCWCRYH